MPSDEIWYEVNQTSDKCAEEYCAWLALRGIQFPLEGIKIMLRGLFEFTYLHHWSGRAAIRNLTKAKIAEFYQPFSGTELETASGLLSPGELLVLFFQFLSDAGYDINAKRLADEITRLRPKAQRPRRQAAQ